MEIKSYPCHGWVIDRTTVEQGEFINDKVMHNNYFAIDKNGDVAGVGKYLWFIESGKHTHENIDTGAVTDCVRGWNTLDTPHTRGEYRMRPVEDTAVWCFNAPANSGTLPNCSFFRLGVGETMSFNAGDKLFLMDGRLSNRVKEIAGPRQVIMSATEVLVAIEDTLILKVA